MLLAISYDHQGEMAGSCNYPQGCQVQTIKKSKFGHKQFQKGQILKNEKRPNKDQISFKKFVKTTKFKFTFS